MYVTLTATDTIDAANTIVKVEMANGAFAEVTYTPKEAKVVPADDETTGANLLKVSVTMVLAYLSFS